MLQYVEAIFLVVMLSCFIILRWGEVGSQAKREKILTAVAEIILALDNNYNGIQFLTFKRSDRYL